MTLPDAVGLTSFAATAATLAVVFIHRCIERARP